MKCCPVVHEICRGHVHVAKKERIIIIIIEIIIITRYDSFRMLLPKVSQTSPFFSVFWRPFWKRLKFWRRILVPLIVSYHYVKFYVSIIIHLEVININVGNFNFPIGFYSKPHPLWTLQNLTLIPFTTNLKTLGPSRNIYL